MQNVMTGVREYAEGMDVELKFDDEENRFVIYAKNEAGHNCTMVDLLDVLEWVQMNKPKLINRVHEIKFKIINIMDGYKPEHKVNNYQVWALHDDGRRNLCGIFETEQHAQDYIQEQNT